MKRIIVSLSIIAAVAAIIVGATTAFFSDTETSTGNTFTAGAIDLKVDNHCYYNGAECICATTGAHAGECYWDIGSNGHFGDGEVSEDNRCYCTWEETDLDNEVFANFSDLKPGDWGEDTISFHVYSNDAWLCADVSIVEDNDVTCTEPETESTDPSCKNNQVGDGELDNYLEVFAWADMCEGGSDTEYPNAFPGDNIYQPRCDILLTQNPVKLTDYEGTFPIADTTFSIAGYEGTEGLPLTGCETYYIGKAWCFGDMTIENNGTIKCNGVNVQNDAQTDKLKLDVSFKAVQARNNDDFVCSNYYSGKEYTLELENKDPSTWNPETGDGTKGTLTFKSPYDTFDYDLTVQGLDPTTGYSLIYCAGGDWPCTGGIRIAQFTTNGSGDQTINDGSKDLQTDLHSAKIWVILSDDWNDTAKKMTGWRPDKYLFEMNLINYEDSDD